MTYEDPVAPSSPCDAIDLNQKEEFYLGSGEGRGKGTSGIRFLSLSILYILTQTAVFLNRVQSVFTEHRLGVLAEHHRAAHQANGH